MIYFSYRDAEDDDPLGSDIEDDIIYKEEVEQEPEEPSEKIEKVLQHRVGPKWRTFSISSQVSLQTQSTPHLSFIILVIYILYQPSFYRNW